MPDNKANLSVSWKAVAIAATVIAVTSLVICAVIATLNKANTLATVALGLAIIAFIVQILVFIVQAAATTQQGVQAQEIYGSTLRVLATIEEKAEGTQRAVSTINDRMLGALLEKAIPETASSGVPFSSPEFSNAVAERVNELAGQARSSRPVARSENTSRGRSPQTSEMQTFPDIKDARRVMPKLVDLDNAALQSLNSLGEDQASASPFKGLPYLVSDKELYERGLARRIQAEWSNRPVFVLTPDGITATRMLRSLDIPSNAPPGLADVRAKLQKLRDDMEKLMKNIESSEVPVEGQTVSSNQAVTSS
jgi:hypothetical protein